MLINTTTAISTPKVLLVPYSKWHVPYYHEWMKDEEIQQATASDLLTLPEEYAMQLSWREDADKLTFIICRGLSQLTTSTSAEDGMDVNEKGDAPVLCLKDEDDGRENMVGDINLFLRVEYEDADEDDDEAEERPVVIGEIELMIAEKKDQGKGYGKAALLAFLRYVLQEEAEILKRYVIWDEFAKRALGDQETLQFGALSVKIAEENKRSLKLFEQMGFRKTKERPSYFGEWELRRSEWDLERDLRVEGYTELQYTRAE